MSETPAAAAVPAGWYADTTVPGQLRWWSGAEWTEHVSVSSSTVPVRPTLPADRPIYSVFIWLIVLLPLVSIGLIFTWQPDFSYLSTLSNDPQAASTAPLTSLYTPGYFLLLASGWVLYGLTAVFAWRDVVWLRKQGVVRPFPWPWVFLYSPVYVIGRSVIVHRVAAPRGRAPIWVFIGVFVLTIIVSIVWTAILFASIMSNLPDVSQYRS